MGDEQKNMSYIYPRLNYEERWKPTYNGLTYKEFKPIIKVKKPLWLRFKLWFIRKFTPKKYRKMLNLMEKCVNDAFEKEVEATINQLLYGSVPLSDSEENYGPPIPANILADIQKKINKAK